MGVKINFAEGEYLKGLDEIVDKIQSEVNKIDKKNSQGFTDALLYVASNSQQRAPVDTGDLRGSVLVDINGEVFAEGITGGGVNAVGIIPEHARKGSVSYNTPYAATQHEQINYNHSKGGQAKYLESVLVESQNRILQLIANGKVDE